MTRVLVALAVVLTVLVVLVAVDVDAHKATTTTKAKAKTSTSTSGKAVVCRKDRCCNVRRRGRRVRLRHRYSKLNFHRPSACGAAAKCSSTEHRVQFGKWHRRGRTTRSCGWCVRYCVAQSKTVFDAVAFEQVATNDSVAPPASSVLDADADADADVDADADADADLARANAFFFAQRHAAAAAAVDNDDNNDDNDDDNDDNDNNNNNNRLVYRTVRTPVL